MKRSNFESPFVFFLWVNERVSHETLKMQSQRKFKIVVLKRQFTLEVFVNRFISCDNESRRWKKCIPFIVKTTQFYTLTRMRMFNWLLMRFCLTLQIVFLLLLCFVRNAGRTWNRPKHEKIASHKQPTERAQAKTEKRHGVGVATSTER